MVSPSKSKLSKIASQQQLQQSASPASQPSQRKSTSSTNNKVKLVKGPKPLIHHRFYLDIERHQVATKIEATIKELGGSIEFFLNKEITHFITDKHHQQSGSHSIIAAAAGTGERNEEHLPSPTGAAEGNNDTALIRHFVPSPAASSLGTPVLGSRNRRHQQSIRSRQHSLHPTHQHNTHGQYVNDYGPATSRTSSPCPPPTTSTIVTAAQSSASTTCVSGATRSVQQTVAAGVGATFSTAPASPATAGLDGKGKPTLPTAAIVLPRNRADAMLQRVRQQKQHHQQHQQTAATLHQLLPSSPLNPPAYVLGTPTKTETGTPPSFHSSSHHKQQSDSPCYSPAGAGTGFTGYPLQQTCGPGPPRQNSPVQLARSWGTPVWSAEQALKFLRKVLDSVQNENRSRSTLLARTGDGSVNKSGPLDAGRGGRLPQQHRNHRRHHHHPHQNAHHLRAHFIKIECRSTPANFRPVYQEFKQWPVLLSAKEDLSSKKAPFADANQPHKVPKAAATVAGGGDGDAQLPVKRTITVVPDGEGPGKRMTRKLSSNSTATTPTPVGKSEEVAKRKQQHQQPQKPQVLEKQPPPRDCGYCEICRIEYDSLTVHVQSEGHKAFVQNDDNFLSLDRLLGSFGGGEGGGLFGGRGTIGEGGLLEKNDDGAVGGAASVAAVTPTLDDFFRRNEATEREPQAEQHQQQQQEGEVAARKKTTSSATVKVTVTTTTTAAADELIEPRENPIGYTETHQQQQQQEKHQKGKKIAADVKENVKKKKVNDSTAEGTPGHAEAPQSSCTPINKQGEVSDGLDARDDAGDGATTNDTQELIKRVLDSTVAYFGSDSAPRRDKSGRKNVAGRAKYFKRPAEKNEAEERQQPVAGDSGKVKRAANSNSVLAGDSEILSEESISGASRVVKKVKRGKSTGEQQGAAGDIVGVLRRFSRSAAAAAASASASTTVDRRKVSDAEQDARSEETGSTETPLEEKEEEEDKSGMFGRRSAIHHHPHNQLNHHNHQKHKSTLSALLLKQQQEREQEQQKESEKQNQDTIASITNTDKQSIDHATGMKVITDFRPEQADLVADKTAVVVAVSTATAATGAVGVKGAKETPPIKRRKRRGATTDDSEQHLAMGLKASTAAMNKHHHHHHHLLHPHDDDGGGKSVIGAKTRHASAEVVAHHHLLECDGLDPKNTKRISLGLRQNPKRANLNEDFTSLLDETLERSRTTSASSTAAAAAVTTPPSTTTTPAASARKAQAKIRQQQKQSNAVAKALTKDDSSRAIEDDSRRLFHTNSGCNEGEQEEEDELLRKHVRTGKLVHQDQTHHNVGSSESGSVGKRTGTSGAKKGTSAAALEDIKVRGIRWRAPSPKTRPPVKSPLLYKVIEQSTPTPTASLRLEATSRMASASSSSTMVSPRKMAVVATHSSSIEETANNPCGNTGTTNATSPNAGHRRSSKSCAGKGASPKKNGIIVKIRRVRQSELSLLNDEAENFMFPRKDDSSSEVDTDDDRQTSSEGYRGPAGGVAGGNNYSIDLPSSSEGDRTKMELAQEAANEMDEEEIHERLTDAVEDEMSPRAETDDEEQHRKMKCTGVAGRKRKKAIPASKERAPALESDPSPSSPSSAQGGITAPSTVKRQRLEEKAKVSSVCSGRRKGQKTIIAAEYDKCQEPAGSRQRFPDAPIQPSPVAAAARLTPSSSPKEHRMRHRRRSPLVVVPGDDDRCAADDDEKTHEDDNDDDKEEREEEEQRPVKRRGGVAIGRGGRGRRKRMQQQEQTVTSTSTAATTAICSCSATVIRRGRGGRRGRRGRGAVSYRSGRGRMPASATAANSGGPCRCGLLDATRMPPPSGTIAGASWRRQSSDDDESTSSSNNQASSTPARRKGGSRASKTKTTPPSLVQREQSPSSVSSSCDIVNSSAGGCYTISGSSNTSCGKGKEDGMGAVFKWINFRKRCEEIEPYRFAFERVPSLEPWYETFQRQDDGTEKVYEYFGSTGYRKLPYEMGPLPALGQNCCILNYKVVACRKSNRTASLQSCSSSSMEPVSPGKRFGGSRPSSADTPQPATDGTAGAGGADVDAKKLSPSTLSSLPLKKRKLFMKQDAAAASAMESGAGTSGTSGTTEAGPNERMSSHGSRLSRLIAGANERPRKSPREHASTLAILSLLQQQQHRKRAAAIKILTSPKKATTATATQTSAYLDHPFFGQDVVRDVADALSHRSSSRTSERGGASSSNGGIKFERPLFPDSSYVNSRILCQEMDAFLTEELNRVASERELASSVVKKEDPDDVKLADEDVHKEGDQKIFDYHKESTKGYDEAEDEALVLPPSVAREGIAIERNNLPVSKRDLVDVLQSVGSEPPLTLKLVQRCESVVKKIVQYDRKTRPMLASRCGAGLGISSISSTPIGLQLFDSGSMLAACPGSGPGGGSLLKKRINRTGWPTNKRKIGTRTRLQSRFLVRTSKASGGRRGSRGGGRATSKSAPSSSIKKEEPDDDAEQEEDDDDEGEENEEEEEEDDTEKTDDDDRLRARRQPRRRKRLSHDGDGDDADEDDDEEQDVEEDEHDREGEEDDAETVVGAYTSTHSSRRQKAAERETSDSLSTSHEKTERREREQQEKDESREEEVSSNSRINVPEDTLPLPAVRSKKRCTSSKSEDSTKLLTTACASKENDDDLPKPLHETNNDRKVELQDGDESNEKSGASIERKERKKKDESNRLSSSTVLDSMPTLRAALMRDSHSQLQRHLTSPLLASAILAPKIVPGPMTSSGLVSPGSNNRGTAPGVPIRGTGSVVVGCTSVCPTSTGQPTVVGSSCCKYVTKTTTTMTRVDYDGVTAGAGTSSGKASCGRKSRERVEASDETDGTARLMAGTAGVVDVTRVGEWSNVETTGASGSGNPTANRTNRHRVAGASSSVATANNVQQPCAPVAMVTNEDDDKECDSISSRSIFVSDDCDTTSSSTALNAPDEGLSGNAAAVAMGAGADSLHVNSSTSGDAVVGENVQKNTCHLTHECAESSENDDFTAEDVVSHEEGTTPKRVDMQGRGPRTQSARIRNKMAKSRGRIGIIISRELAVQTAMHQQPVEEKTTTTTKNHRRISSSLLAPPAPSQPKLPPPSMMPLSPPLTTSTSSSSSSSCGTDEKPMSPVAVSKRDKEEEEDEMDSDQDRDHRHRSKTPPMVEESSAAIITTPVLTPSKIKTRSSTFGRTPAKRTYGRAKAVTPLKYPYVALVRTSFFAKTESEQQHNIVPSPASSPTIVAHSKRKRRRKETTESDVLSTKIAPTKRRRNSKPNSTAKPSKARKPVITKGKRTSKLVKTIEQTEKLEVVEEQLHPNEHFSDGGLCKKKEVMCGESPAIMSVVPKVVVGRKQELKIKVFNHGRGHFKSISSVAVENDVEHHAPMGIPLAMFIETTVNETAEEDREAEEKMHHPQVELVEEHLMEEEEEEEIAEEEEQHQHGKELGAQNHVEASEEEFEEEEAEEAAAEEEEEGKEENEEEEEHIEMLELMEVDEEELNRQHGQAEDVIQDDDAEEQEDDAAFLTGDEDEHEEEYQLEHDDEALRMLMMADHDYGNRRQHHHRSMSMEAEFVDVEGLAEEDFEEREQDDEEDDEEVDLDGTGDDDTESENLEYDLQNVAVHTTTTAMKRTVPNTHNPLAIGAGKQNAKMSSSLAGTATAATTMTARSSSTSTNVAPLAAVTQPVAANSSHTSPTKYSPRKLRKPRGRWYRER